MVHGLAGFHTLVGSFQLSLEKQRRVLTGQVLAMSFLFPHQEGANDDLKGVDFAVHSDLLTDQPGYLKREQEKLALPLNLLAD